MDPGLDFDDDSLRLLSMDAGDMRTLSQIIILGEFMSRLEWIKKTVDSLPPCRYFNMIIGVGLGGIIAILFGVFGMTVEQARYEFVMIYDEVFKDASLPREVRSNKLRKAIESLLERKELPLDTKLLRDGASGSSTRTIVCATPSVDIKFCRLFRSFKSQHISDDPTIVEAIMATCSTPDLFTPVSIGLERRKEEFIGGVYTASNPVNELIKEAHEFFGPERMVSYIMSVGAGRTPILSLGQHPTTLDAKGLEKVVTNADKTAEEIEQRLGMLNVYFRFAVDRGLDAPLSSDESGSIETCTKSYFQSPVFNERIERALRCLSDPGRIQIDRIYRTKQANLKAISGLPPLSAFHVPRPTPMGMLLKHLSEDGTRKRRIAIVSGMGGCGKSQLVSYFARTYGHNYQHILFIDASSVESTRNTIVQRVRSLGHGLNIRTVEEALELLSQMSWDAWLMIFDNADSTNFELSDFTPDCDHGSIIITTCNPSLGLLSQNSHITLDIMSPFEATSVLLSCVMKPGSVPSESDQKHAGGIVEELGYLPVAIVQAGCFIRLRDCMDTYLEKYRKNRRSFLQRPAKAQLDKHHHSIYITLDLIAPALKPRSLQLSSLLGFFHYTGIPLALFERVAQRSFKLQPFDLFDVPPLFQETISLLQDIISPYGEWDEEDFRDALEDLQNYSLVTLVNVGTVKTIRYHTLVRAWAQDRLTLPEQAKFRAAAIRMLACGMSSDDEDLFEYLTVHIDSLSSEWDNLHINDRATFANVLCSDGDVQFALKTWVRIHEEVTKAHGEDHLRTSEASLQLAECYRVSGEPERAIPLAKKAMEYRMATLGKDDLGTLRASACYSRLLSYMEAKALQSHVLDIRKKVLEPNHTEIAQAMEELAHTLSKKFQSISAACNLMNEAIMIRTTTQGENHRATLRAKERLASINEKGWLDTAEASRLLENVVNVRRRDLGPNHRETMRSMAQLARSYEQQSQYAPAGELWADLLKARRKQSNAEYGECTQALTRIAEGHTAAGNHAEAEQIYQTLLDLYQDVHGMAHESTISTLERIYHLLETQNKSSDADRLLESILDAQRKAYGDTSFQVMSTIEKLASSYEQQRKFEEAVPFRMELVSLKSELCGPDDPDTKSAMLALDAAFNNIDTQLRYNEAIKSWRPQVTAMRLSQELHEDRSEWFNKLAEIAWEFRDHGLYQMPSSTPQDAHRLWDDLLGTPRMPSQIMCATEALAEKFLRNDQREHSEALFEDALAARAKLSGETADSTIAATEALITIYCSKPPVSETPITPPSEKERQIRIRNCMADLWQRKQRLLGYAHPDTIDALKRLAKACEDHSHLDDAERYLKEIISVYQRMAGERDKRTVDALNKLVAFHFSHNMLEQGIVVSKQIIDIKRSQFGENDPETRIELGKLLERCHDHRMWEDRLSILRESLELRCNLAECAGASDSGWGGLNEMILADMELLAHWYSARKQHDEAIQWAQRALDIHYRTLPHDHTDILKSTSTLAAVYAIKADSIMDRSINSTERMGCLAFADSAFLRLIEIRQKEFGEYSESTIEACGMYMQLLVQGVRFDDLEQFLERLLKIVEMTYDSMVLNSRNTLNLTDSSGSIPNLRLDIPIASPATTDMPGSPNTSYAPTTHSESDFSNDPTFHSTFNPNTNNSPYFDFNTEKEKPLPLLSLIDKFIWQIGKQPCVKRLSRIIVEISKKGLGSEHKFTVAAMRGLALLYIAEEMHTEAQTLFEEVLDTFDTLDDPHDHNVAWILEPLAYTYRISGQYEKAEDTLNRVLAIDADAFPGGSEISLRARQSIARLRIDQERWEEAEEILLELIHLRDFLKPETHRLAMGDLLAVYSGQGKTGKMEALARDFLDLFRGPEYATSCPTVNVGLVYVFCGRHQEAMGVVEKFLEQSRLSPLISFEDKRTARSTLLDIYIATGNFRRARNYFAKVIDAELAPPSFIRDAILKSLVKEMGIPDTKKQQVADRSFQALEKEPKSSQSRMSEGSLPRSDLLDKGKGPMRHPEQRPRQSSNYITDIEEILETDPEDEDYDDYDSISELEATAAALEARGDYNISQSLLTKVVMAKLRITVRSLTPFSFEKSNIYLEDQNVLKSMERLAKNYEKHSKHEDARRVWESILYICSLGYDENKKDPCKLRAMNGLAESYEELQLHDMALSLRESLLAVLESGVGRDVDQICEQMEQIASLCVKQGRLEDAEKWSNRVLNVRMQAHTYWLGQCTPGALNQSLTYDAALDEDQDGANAIHESHGDALKTNVTKALAALEWIAWKMDERKDYIKSGVIWGNILSVRRHLLGESDPVTLETAMFLAMNLNSQGRGGESEKIQKEFRLDFES